jgi:hypothetical protein
VASSTPRRPSRCRGATPRRSCRHAPTLEVNSHAHLPAPLEALAGELGYTVAYRELDRVDGRCDYRARRIDIADRLAPNGRQSVLVDELAHTLVGHEAGLAEQDEELVVEAVVLCPGCHEARFARYSPAAGLATIPAVKSAMTAT